MSSFFTAPGAQKKRKRAAAPDAPKKRVAAGSASHRGAGERSSAHASRPTHSRSKAAPTSSSHAPAKKSKSAPPPQSVRKKKEAQEEEDEDDESISGSDSDGAGDDDDLDSASGDGSDADEAETAAERRLRLAERYLENVRQEVGGRGGAAGADGDIYAFDAEDVDRDLIAERLMEDVAEAKGRVYRQLAGELGFAQAAPCVVRWNAKNVNGVAVCAPYAYTVTSDVHLTKWRLQERPDEQQRVREAKRRAWQEEALQKKLSNKSRKRGGKHKQKLLAAAAQAAASVAEAVAAVPPRKQPERVLFRRGDPKRRNDKDYKGHVGSILTVAASQDGRFVVTGGADRRMVVWDAATLQPLRVFTHHRDAVTGLAFRRGTNQLYSCSKDRTIKVWSLDELAYVQTLFGHQDDVGDIDALAQEKCVSVGTRDRTARMWKVVEETQLVFRGGGSGGSDRKRAKDGDGAQVDPNSLAHEGSMDRVAMLDDELFVTGSDNGALALWSTQKKKPLFVIPRAHGIDPVLSGREQYDAVFAEEAAATATAAAGVVPASKTGASELPPPPPPQPRWITALRTIPYSDVVFSGSWDGCVRVWRLSKDKRKLEAVGALGAADSSSQPSASSASAPIPGVVNDIAVFERGERGRDGLSVVVAVGREHRLGRWGQAAGSSARNGAVVFEISKASGSSSAANGVNGINGANGVNGVNGYANKA